MFTRRKCETGTHRDTSIESDSSPAPGTYLDTTLSATGIETFEAINSTRQWSSRTSHDTASRGCDAIAQLQLTACGATLSYLITCMTLTRL